MGLERVTEGMAEIEQSARAARLPLVRLDDLCLGAGARLDGMTPLAALAREHIRPILLEARLERRKIKGCNVAVAHHRAARARKRSRDAASSRCNDTLANNDGVASPGKHHLDNCLALAGGQGGRAVAHRHTF